MSSAIQALAALLKTERPVGDDIESLLVLLIRLQRRAGLILLEPTTRLSGKPGAVQLLLPAASGRATLSVKLLSTVMKLLEDAHSALGHAQWQQLLDQLSQDVGFGMNTPRLLEAAHALDLPVIWLQADIFQVGHGSRSRWLQSTFTDESSNFAVRLARQKTHTNQRLRQAGLPVADQVVVTDVTHAVTMANRFGYPVVIKPADSDGGKGVYADLRDEGSLRTAHVEASRVSSNILLERHIPGRDYRLTIFHGALAWAVERQPAGITGDGHSTVQALISAANQQPVRQGGSHSLLKPLPADEEAQRILAEEGMSLVSVPDAGCFVPLRRNANVSSGGMPVAVNDRVHPDNAKLAIQAVEALRLDVGGVDLILPDIARSWRETGGVICEVNAQPQLNHLTAPHISRELLQRLLPAGGRIPILIVAGAPRDSDLPMWLMARLQASGYVAACATPQGIWLGDEQLAGAESAHRASEILLTNPRVSAAVISVADDSALQQGLFADRFDWLILDGSWWAVADDAPRRTLTFANYFAGHCSNRLLTVAGSPLSSLSMADKASGKRYESLSRAELALRLEEDFGGVDRS
ncbi:MAG: cyanophycin synthetase [Pseudomonadota bacterium]